MKKDFCFTLEGDEGSLTICYPPRDLSFIQSPVVPEGARFTAALGVWENFSLSRGQPTQLWTLRSRTPLLSAAEALLERLEDDADLLNYQFEYGFPAEGRRRSTTALPLTIDDVDGVIEARPPGHVTFTSGPPEARAVVDLRRQHTLATERGELRIYHRRRRGGRVGWPMKLLELIRFLWWQNAEEIRVRHHYGE